MRPNVRSGLIGAMVLLIAGLLAGTSDAQPDGQQYPGPRYRDATVRLDVTPKNAQVYIDGYYVGTVDDFDGMFHHLQVQPGRHEIVLYLQGYRTIKQNLDLPPGRDYKVRQKMVKLGAGDATEPPPTPPPAAQGGQPEGQEPPGAYAPPPPRGPRRPMRRPPMGREPGEAANYGELAIRVQPADAEVLIDGERWQGPEGDQPLVVHLAEGSHHVEVRKDGFRTFSTDVTVRDGERSPLNVSLQSR